MKEYNGHRSWAAWNVALWVANDESLYRTALRCISKTTTRGGTRNYGRAAEMFIREVGEGGKTPDGAPWGKLNVRLALEGLE